MQAYTSLPVDTPRSCISDLLAKSTSLFKTKNRLALPFICQIFFLVGIGIFITASFRTYGKLDDYLSVIGGMSVLIVYYVLMLFSISNAVNYNQGRNLSDYIEGLWRSRPILTFNVEQFHYERSGKNAKKVVTLNNKENFAYFSWRDISERICIPSEIIRSHTFVKAIITTEILFADPVSAADYERKNYEFKMRPMTKDSNETFYNEKTLVNYEEKADGDYFSFGSFNCILNPCFLYFMVLIGLPLPIYMYLGWKTFYVGIEVGKIVTMRYNLFEGEFADKFSQISPAMEFDGKEEIFPANKVTGVFIENQKALPTKEELDESMKYCAREDVYQLLNANSLK